MSKTIVIPDIHDKIDVADFILNKHVGYGKVIFTGDYFDSYVDKNTPKTLISNIVKERTIATATWLKKIMSDDRHVTLFGNHDFSYMYPGWASYCSGFDTMKLNKINEILGDDIRKLKSYHHDHGILFSHAGITNGLFFYEQEEFFQRLDYLIDDGIRAIKDKRTHQIFGAGWSRGGQFAKGGIIWEDFDVHIPIKGIKQIFGHSIQENPTFKFFNEKNGNSFKATIHLKSDILDKHISEKDWSFVIDTFLRNYLIIDDETNEISVYRIQIKNEFIDSKEVLKFKI